MPFHDDSSDPEAEWILAASDQLRAWALVLETDRGADETGTLALTLLALCEAQSRIIGELASRVTTLEVEHR
ncbi:hypothetical protein ACH3VR_13940 [Microbacterium sp. B2969]|uniref:Uncharacterized protein n=1 Tax=Microbacterium alkaliflavum TaxID=3248839 RepID=A0ABW7Q9A6_9MICO